MNIWLWIIIAIVVVVLICYGINWLINYDDASDKSLTASKLKKTPMVISIGPDPFSRLYLSENRDINLPLEHLKYLTIWGDIDHDGFDGYNLEWGSSLMEHMYGKPLPNYIETIDDINATFGIVINTNLIDPEVAKSRVYEQLFLTLRDNTDTLLGTYKIVLYYDYNMYINANPSFA